VLSGSTPVYPHRNDPTREGIQNYIKPNTQSIQDTIYVANWTYADMQKHPLRRIYMSNKITAGLRLKVSKINTAGLRLVNTNKANRKLG
jgi:hypothetical protein